MKKQVKDYVDDLVHRCDWEGDVIDLSDDQKDALVLEWLLAYPSWQDDYISPAICVSKRVGYLRLLYRSNDPASLMLKDEMYLSLETTLRESVLEYYGETYTKPEAFAGYEAGQ
jgi:hypothetical protein